MRLAAAAIATVLHLGAATALAQPAEPPVDVAHPITREVTDFDHYTGRFEAVKSVEIVARVSGYLEEIHFRDGDVVEKGDMLFKIDPRTFEAALARAEAQLGSARAARNLAEVELQRAEQLANRNVGTAQEVDRTTATLAQAEAEVKVAEAELRQAELEVSFTEIRAPIAGRMSETRLDEGNYVLGGTAGSTVLTTIVSVDPIHFVFTASEADFLRYSRLSLEGNRRSSRDFATPVEVRLMDEDDFQHTGRMNFVDNALDPNAGTIEGRAVIENSDEFLTPGLFGRLRLPGSGPYQAVLIPDSAILADQRDFIVMTVGEDGTVAPRKVKTGPVHGGLRVIREGLSTEDRIIVAGLQRARPGQTVTPQEVEILFADEEGRTTTEPEAAAQQGGGQPPDESAEAPSDGAPEAN